VHLKFVIRDDGFVDKVKPVPAVDSTKDRAIIESAVKAVRQWNLMSIPGSEPGRGLLIRVCMKLLSLYSS
jgi:outer membrane biosynthesis protein TonB